VRVGLVFVVTAVTTAVGCDPSGHAEIDADCAARTWHVDFDGDGSGHPTQTVEACEPPDGYVLDGRDCNDADPSVIPGRPTCPFQHGGTSCRDVGAIEGDGAYVVDLDGAGPDEPVSVWCDMTTDGGRWTALINPSAMTAIGPPGVAVSGVAAGGTSDTCTAPPVVVTRNGWYGHQYYRCGDISARMTITWPNPIAATDVMFVATVQGNSGVTVLVNAANAAAAGNTTNGEGAICSFWNASAATVTPGTNACFSTTLDEPPAMFVDLVSGALVVELTAGPACSPTCAYGSGMNIQKLFVR
jgi:hypothetical protein